MRAQKAGEASWENACGPREPIREISCSLRDIIHLVGESLRRLKREDEEENRDRLLRAMRSAGYLRYRADPETKRLVRCDDEWWMQDSKQELPEASHRHPAAWWDLRIGFTQPWFSRQRPLRCV